MPLDERLFGKLHHGRRGRGVRHEEEVFEEEEEPEIYVIQDFKMKLRSKMLRAEHG